MVQRPRYPRLGKWRKQLWSWMVGTDKTVESLVQRLDNVFYRVQYSEARIRDIQRQIDAMLKILEGEVDSSSKNAAAIQDLHKKLENERSLHAAIEAGTNDAVKRLAKQVEEFGRQPGTGTKEDDPQDMLVPGTLYRVARGARWEDGLYVALNDNLWMRIINRGPVYRTPPGAKGVPVAGQVVWAEELMGGENENK